MTEKSNLIPHRLGMAFEKRDHQFGFFVANFPNAGTGVGLRMTFGEGATLKEKAMPAVTKDQAIQKLAEVVEKARPAELPEIFSEIFPERPMPQDLSAADLAKCIRAGLEAEEIVDLWNVIFPADRNVWYGEEDQRIHFNEEAFGYVEAD